MDKTAEELEAERIATEEAARVAAEAETARLAAEAEAKKTAAEGKTPEELAAEEAAAKAAKPDWKDARIAKLAADKAAMAAELAKFQKAAPKVPAEGGEPPLTAADVERLANEKAEAIAQRKSFNTACNEAAKQGRKDFPDFDASVKELTKVAVDETDPASMAQYDDFLAAALETGEAPKIIYTLGRDPGEYLRIAGLSPVKRAQELATLAAADAVQVSNLPKPITPVSGKNAGPSEITPDDPSKADKLSSAEWHRRRQAQVAAQPTQNERRRLQG